MSRQESLDVVRRGYEAFNSGDINTLLTLLDDNVEFDMPAVEGVPFGGRYRGKQQVADFFGLLDEYEEVLLFEPRDFIAEEDKVAVRGFYRARVKSTGRTAESPWVHIITLRNGKLFSLFEMTDTAAVARAYQRGASA
jgi:ketosteroid isomerase-like protein